MRKKGYHPSVINVLSNARKKTTNKLYDGYITKWEVYCNSFNRDPTVFDIPFTLNFLQIFVDQGLSYSVINTIRSALSTILISNGVTFGSHPIVVQYLKGVYNLKPPVSKYNEIWDLNVVLDYLKTLAPASSLSLEILTKKLVTLILIVTGQRPQILKCLRVDRLHVHTFSFEFKVSSTDFKQSRPGYTVKSIVLKGFPSDRRLCIYTYIKEYLKRTQSVRKGCKQLILLTRRPFTAACLSTMSHWVKQILKNSGIPIERYTAGSCRSAVASKLSYSNCNIQDIMNLGGWTRESTFTKYYKKPVRKNNIVNSILS